jgi:hypothetical protein
MSKQVRERLEAAASLPRRNIDVDALMERAQHRRRRRLGAIAASLLMVVTAGVAVFAVSDGADTTSVKIAPAGQLNAMPSPPDGWKRITLGDARFSIDVPDEWVQSELDVNEEEGPTNLLVVGSSPRPYPGVIAGCFPPERIPTTPGVWISLYEFQEKGSFQFPNGGYTDVANLPVRDENTFAAGGNGPRCTADGTYSESGPNTGLDIAFRDQGRPFDARMIVIGGVGGPPEALARQVLSSLRVFGDADGGGDVVAAPEPTTTTNELAMPPVTTLAPVAIETFPIGADDEADVRATVTGWLAGVDAGMNRAYIEDADSIEAEITAAIAYRVSKGVPGLRAEIASVGSIDADRALVTFTARTSGLALPFRDAVVLKVDGEWKVSRDTVCMLLAQAHVTCPQR